MVEIKFCGLTRPDDAAFAAELGAGYVGMIFAGGPRERAPDVAHAVAGAARGDRTDGRPLRVGVFAEQGDDAIAAIVDSVPLDVIQLHAGVDAERIARLRARLGRSIWPVLRIAGADVPDGAAALFDAGDAVVLDAKVSGVLGGSGVAFDWTAVATQIDVMRTRAPLVLAGGLTPSNISVALAAMRPDVVDVSSGVESAPGIKDHHAMRAFAAAVAQWNQETT